MSRSSCNTLKMVTGKPFGITKVGTRIMSIITVGDHEETRNLSELVDGLNVYTKTMITCDEDLVGQIYVGGEELKVRYIGPVLCWKRMPCIWEQKQTYLHKYWT